MNDTKEQILQTSLRLFASDGYEAVSVSRIAEALHITKGALYKHYDNKRAIFDAIVQRMYDIDRQRAQLHHVPEHTFDQSPEEYDDPSMADIIGFALSQFRFWAEDAFAAQFRKLITLEQYHDAEMALLYRNCLTEGPVCYLADLFRQMMAGHSAPSGDPHQLALSFYGPFILLLQAVDGGTSVEDGLKQLNNHIQWFTQQTGFGKEKES